MFDLFSKISSLVAAIRKRDWPGVEAAVLAIAALEGGGSIAGLFADLLAAVRAGHLKAILIEAGTALIAVAHLFPDAAARMVVIQSPAGKS